MPHRIVASWSSGKDSAWMIHQLRANPAFELVGLLTTVNRTHQRVALHSTREAILQAQAEALDLPLAVVDLPWPCTDADYHQAMATAHAGLVERGIDGIAYGDLFLTSVRDFRLAQLAGTGLEAHFPLWGCDTQGLARTMISAGLEAYLTAVDPQQIPGELAGRRYDHELLNQLPPSADPCAENGEFHTCVVAGPMFQQRLAIRPGEIVERGGMVFADLVLGD